MTNKDMARQFRLLAELMELMGENPFKVKSYRQAYLTLRSSSLPIGEMDAEALSAIKGIGKAISGKILEIRQNGTISLLARLQSEIPAGVVEMLEVPGLGPKKIRTVWKELGIETLGELLYACQENRLLSLKGFGEKTQREWQEKIKYYQRSRGRFLFPDAEAAAKALLRELAERYPAARAEWTGAIRRGCAVIDSIDILVAADPVPDLSDGAWLESLRELEPNRYEAVYGNGFPVRLTVCLPADFGTLQFRLTGSDAFLASFERLYPGMSRSAAREESAIFDRSGCPPIPPERRDSLRPLERTDPILVSEADIRGVVHAHTTYSDGADSLSAMAAAAAAAGYDYLGITDHSRAAFYANGLREDRLLLQWDEIDRYHASSPAIRLLKGIESDILYDGSLDYPDEILRQFDFIIASVHSNLKMDMDKATARLIRAIEHPCTTILGHPTGRLLLNREGYPIDHERVLAACAANQVAVELNANPNRLDLDWRWLEKALEMGVVVSVNPDAHSRDGIRDIRYGVLAARKGGLPPDHCLTCYPSDNFLAFARKSAYWRT